MARTKTTSTIPVFHARPILRIIGICALALTTANCSNNPQRYAASVAPSHAGNGSGGGIDPKYGVKASPRLFSEGEAIPKGGGRRFSGKPYVVAGRTYVPREDARGYVREGLASWYGAAFHGRMTANGEVFDRHSIAAAHPTLPLPSYARVTNLNNGYSMVVRVNDRGPYHANRVMDVSENVARALEFHRKGTERVRVEYIGRASIAGSDDRKLLASLRTDGRPSPTGAPIMMADLGPDQPSPDRFSRTSPNPLAFKPASNAEASAADRPDDSPVAEPVRQPRRLAPIVVASVASVPIPAALQPTSQRAASFKPQPVAEKLSDEPVRSSAKARSAPLNLVPPPIKLAAVGDERRLKTASIETRSTDQRSTHAGTASPIGPESKPGSSRKLAVSTSSFASASISREEPKGTTLTKANFAEAKTTAPIQKVAAKIAATASTAPAFPASSKLPLVKLGSAPTMNADAKLSLARLAAASAAPPAKPAAKPRLAHVAGVN